MMTDNTEANLALEMRIARFLRWGVIVTAVLLTLGTISQFNFAPNPFAAFHDYRPQNIAQELQRLWEMRQWGILLSYAGLFILISLPLIRVLLTALLFWRQRDRVLAALATLVLILLVLSFTLGLEV